MTLLQLAPSARPASGAGDPVSAPGCANAARVRGAGPAGGSSTCRRRRSRSLGGAGAGCAAALGRPARSAPQPPANAKRIPPKAGAGRVGARERRGPQTLEETLEILGAGELEVDNGRGETLNDTGVRHLRVEVQKNTPFSRLLERLSERSKKN